MADRMYWFDHRVPEDVSDPNSPTSKSCSNSFEVEMVAGLVKYLISGNAYDLGDIAVLVRFDLLKARNGMANQCRHHTTVSWQLSRDG